MPATSSGRDKVSTSDHVRAPSADNQMMAVMAASSRCLSAASEHKVMWMKHYSACASSSSLSDLMLSPVVVGYFYDHNEIKKKKRLFFILFCSLTNTAAAAVSLGSLRTWPRGKIAPRKERKGKKIFSRMNRLQTGRETTITSGLYCH